MHAAIQWSKVVAASITVVALASAGIFAPIFIHATHGHAQRLASQPTPIPVTDEDQRKIVRGLLLANRRFFVQPIDTHGKLLPMPELSPMVLLNTSVVICDPNAPDKTGYPECSDTSLFFSTTALEYDAEIPRKLRLELVAANRRPVQVPDPKVTKVIYRPRADVDDLVWAEGGWETFSNKFPGAAGYVEYSRAVQSEDGRYALIYEERHCQGACFSGGEFHYFASSGNTWRLLSTAGVWVN